MITFTVVLGIILILLIYLLCVPVKIRLNLVIDNKISADSEIRIFPFEFKFRKKAGKPHKSEKTAKPPKPAEGRKKWNFSKLGMADIPIIYKLIGEIQRLAGQIIKAPDYSLKADIAGGAAEPDLTGEIYGAYQALRFVLPESFSVSYRPDFMAGKFIGTIQFGVAVRIIKLIKETLVFIFRLPIIKLIKLCRKLRKGG